jgi:phosphoserine phosphatase
MPPREATAVVVFDLDGTILEVNSFPQWVRFLIAGGLPELGARRRMVLSLRTMSQLLQRKLLRSSHEDFQWRLQRLWQSACRARPCVSLEGFEAALLRHVRPNLATTLELVAESQIDAVLATAAAEDYATGLGRRLGFRHVLATRSGRRGGAPANSGERKRQEVLALLRGLGWHERPIILFTDHVDDLPLIRDSSVVYWCGPAAALDPVAAGAINARFVFCGKLDDEALALQLLQMCQPERLRASAVS